MEVPITEQCNPITTAIDTASPEGIVQMLHDCDREIFNGWKQHKGLFDQDTISTIEEISSLAVEILKNPNEGLIVLSGCGTSGRLAFLVARGFNKVLEESGKQSCFQYLIAGRDKALFTSQEAPEDDPQVGIEMLKEVVKGKKRVLFIGITCGLSAPYVAGQLVYCLENLEIFTPVLLGFNPTHLARFFDTMIARHVHCNWDTNGTIFHVLYTCPVLSSCYLNLEFSNNRKDQRRFLRFIRNIKIEKWDKTFLDVVKLLENKVKEKKCFILNPIVGPEPITGSSRMKSGTATKILLETIFISSVDKFLRNKQSNVELLLKSYQEVCEFVYTQSACISQIIQLSGNSLKSGGSVYYIGWDSLGIVGMIDASECPPTYGSSLSDIRGFIETGYALLSNREGDLSNMGKYFRISIQDFYTDIVPTLKDTDLIVFLVKDNLESVTEKLWQSSCKKTCICFQQRDKTMNISKYNLDASVSLDMTMLKFNQSLGADHIESWLHVYKEIATKWILNATTTGAHILKGKVYQNIMVDVKVSNNKLFFRAVGILQKFSNLPKETCQEYLLRSIYQTEDLSDVQRCAQIQDHIFTATPMDKVVPTALVATILKCSIEEAKRMLSETPIIRTAISNILDRT